MLTGDGYRASLADGRRVYRQGRDVPDVRADAFFAASIDEVAAGYDAWYDADPSSTNAALLPPRSVDEMRDRAPGIESLDLLLGTTYQSVNALRIAIGRLDEASAARYGPRVTAYLADVAARDLRIAECITDAKGDRTKAPAQQADPDAYVHVVDRRADGVVIRGAKMHISGAAIAHELLVLPTKTMHDGEEEYAIACAVPVAADGVHVVVAGASSSDRDPRETPSMRAHHPILECTCVFDDVFVPTERVFLDGEVAHAAVFAHALGLWERLGGVSHMVTQADELVGLAQLIAEANGTARVAHIREKIDEMIIHATLLRAGMEAAIAHASSTPDGAFHPDDLFTNVTKYLGATQYHLMVRHLHDIAGGAVVTAPSMADFDHPVVGPLVDKYLATPPHRSGSERAQLLHAIRDLTADAYAGWSAVGNIHGGGGLFAQRLVSRRLYDMERAKDVARRAAGLEEEVSS